MGGDCRWSFDDGIVDFVGSETGVVAAAVVCQILMQWDGTGWMRASVFRAMEHN